MTQINTDYIAYEPEEGPSCAECGNDVEWRPVWRSERRENPPRFCAFCQAAFNARDEALGYLRIAADRETKRMVFKILDNHFKCIRGRLCNG